MTEDPHGEIRERSRQIRGLFQRVLADAGDLDREARELEAEFRRLDLALSRYGSACR
jgi:hypothetical protein